MHTLIGGRGTQAFSNSARGTADSPGESRTAQRERDPRSAISATRVYLTRYMITRDDDPAKNARV